MGKIVMVRRLMETPIIVGSKIEPWGVVTAIEDIRTATNGGDRFFSVIINVDGVVDVAMYLKVSDVLDFVVARDEHVDQSIELCKYAISESHRRNQTGSVTAVLGATGIEG